MFLGSYSSTNISQVNEKRVFMLGHNSKLTANKPKDKAASINELIAKINIKLKKVNRISDSIKVQQKIIRKSKKQKHEQKNI